MQLGLQGRGAVGSGSIQDLRHRRTGCGAGRSGCSHYGLAAMSAVAVSRDAVSSCLITSSAFPFNRSVTPNLLERCTVTILLLIGVRALTVYTCSRFLVMEELKT